MDENSQTVDESNLNSKKRKTPAEDLSNKKKKTDTRETEDLLLLKDYEKIIEMPFDKTKWESIFIILIDFVNSQSSVTSNNLFWKIFTKLFKSEKLQQSYFPKFSVTSLLESILYIFENMDSNTLESSDYMVNSLNILFSSEKMKRYLEYFHLKVEEYLGKFVTIFIKMNSTISEKYEPLLEDYLVFTSQLFKKIEKEKLYEMVMNCTKDLFVLYGL
jgi:hypothetical protein